MKRAVTLLIIIFVNQMVFAQSNPQVAKPKPFVLGEILELHSNILSEKRTLNIYHPYGFDAKDTTKYPVIYLLDGSADEDFIHIAGLVQFCSFDWVNLLPNSIVVGIATVDRRRDFSFPTTIESDKKLYPNSGQSANFISFIEKELQPFIQQHYKTNQAKTLIGQSMGGLVATEILLKKPSLFNKYIIVSPSLWWNNGSLLNEETLALKDSTLQKTEIYLAVGKEGLTPTTLPRVMEVDANLLAAKITSLNNKSIKLWFDYMPQEDHGSILHQAVLNAFKQFSLYQNTNSK